MWGGPRDHGGLNGYKQSWQATANAIEGLAQAHCDLPLCLDELSLVKGEDAARVGYQLASGIGRGRAFTSGLAAARLEWRVFLISTGEISLADKIADARTPQRHMPGQAVRFIDLAADAGTGFGLFDHAPELTDQTERRHVEGPGRRVGAPSRSMLHNRTLVPPARPLSRRLLLTAKPVLPRPGASSMYLPISTHPALTDRCNGSRARLACWRPPANWLLHTVFCLGLPARQYEPRADALPIGLPTAAARVPPRSMERFLTFVRRSSATAHPDSNAVDSREPVHQRLGFIRESEGDIEYMIQRESWKSLMAGRDARRTARRACSPRNSQARLRKAVRTPKSGCPGRRQRQRVYVVRHSALFADGGEDA